MGLPNRPAALFINAWTGGHAGLTGASWSAMDGWGAGDRAERVVDLNDLGPEAPPDLTDWTDPRVGWGLVVADNARTDAEKAAGVGVPQVLLDLLAERQGPLLYHVPAAGSRLRRYYADGSPAADWDPSGSPRGRIGDQIPRYLLIYGAPAEIPWRVQYALNMSSYVGRLDLTGAALEGYVAHLRNGWADAPRKIERPVVWSVNFGGADITYLMQGVVADPVWAALHGDSEFDQGIRLADGDATLANLAQALEDARPGLIVTTSHGMTGPLADGDGLRARLGGLVDADEAVLTPDHLGAGAAAGAIWYAHACCSAGADSDSQLQSLFPVGHDIGDTLRGVAATAGGMIAPLPQALLAADPPIRAFVGHVEPTFDWTLRDPYTGQVLTSVLTECLYQNLHQKTRWPIGYALAAVYAQAGAQLTFHQQAIDRVNLGQLEALDEANYRQVAALDRQSLVILGDPAVTLTD
jgi:hypothetical protein